MRNPNSLTPQEEQKKLALFLSACELGIELHLENCELAGILAGMADFLRDEARPLEFFIANPRGIHVDNPTN
jgi:hypothetical protein